MDPFAVLGLAPDLDLDAAELERAHSRLSREFHPDLHRGASTDEQIAVLQRSAAINDAFRALRDRWRRAEMLLELRAPGVLDATKTLPPDFLMTAMEIAEEVAEVDEVGRAALAERLRAAIEGHWTRIHELGGRQDWTAAASALHESRYYRKALQDLEDPA